MNQNWIQLGYQLADSVAGGGYSFAGTCVILAVLNFLGRFIPAFKLRATDEEEMLGIDDVEIGEFAVCSCHRMLSKICAYLTTSMITSNSLAKSSLPTTTAA